MADWIPIKSFKELPKGKDLLVTIKGLGGYLDVDFAYFDKWDDQWLIGSEGLTLTENEKIIAYQPCPEPYQPSPEDE